VLDCALALTAPDPALIHPVPRGVYPRPAEAPLLLLSFGLYASYTDDALYDRAENGDDEDE
jgi:hypothetical protein